MSRTYREYADAVLSHPAFGDEDAFEAFRDRLAYEHDMIEMEEVANDVTPADLGDAGYVEPDAATAFVGGSDLESGAVRQSVFAFCEVV